jgi:hypothetical protein
MRQKMMDHRVRPDCVQCHQLMDPIGFALETFDGIGLERTHDEGTPVDPKARTFDNTQIDGPNGVRSWLAANYSKQFVTVTTEKILTYGLGRGLDHRDMPLVRQLARDAAKAENRFSAIVLGVVKSQPFQMNTRSAPPATNTASTATNSNTHTRN